MMELLTNLFGAIRAGWLQYAEKGMYIGVFFVAMLFLWLVCYDKFPVNTGDEKEKADGRKGLFVYALAAAVLVLCPVSAFFLLKYQTAFFTYSQLFLLIPMTLVIAWAFTEAVAIVLEKLFQDGEIGKRGAGDNKKQLKVTEALAIFVVAFILFMAGTVSPAAVHTNAVENSEKIPGGVKEVLAFLCDSGIDLSQEIVLAPDEVVEYARAYSADIRLLYGRNMWQKELNAYTYDTYAPELEEVHKWLNPDIWEEGPVSDNLSASEALAVVRIFGGSILVLKEEQFIDKEVNAALVEKGYDEVARTAEYIIIELR